MKLDTTLSIPSSTAIEENRTQPAPKKRTLEFLKQLAHSYMAVPAMAAPDLRGAFMN